MDSSSRPPPSSRGKASKTNGRRPLDPKQPVLAVRPLNSVPYTGPPPPNNDTCSFMTESNPSPPINEPALVFLPSHSTKKELDNIVAAAKSGVVLTGSAALGKMGPIVGLVDICESGDAYNFRVSLPGVSPDENTFSCIVQPDGTIVIKGVTSTGEMRVYKNNMMFEMQTQNLCPPGDFSISFQLPGSVDHQQLSCAFGSDGILQGAVKKMVPKGP